MKQARTVASAWRRSHAGTPPAGFTMREEHPDVWVRERHTVLDRWNQVARLVFEAPGTVGVFVLEAGPSGASGHCRALMEQTGLRQASRHPAEWLRRLDVYKEDIDVRALDPNHVLPNIGNVTSRGIWFPLGYP